MCLVCSILVAGAAVNLRPAQQLNKEADKRQNILRAAGMLPANAKIDAEGRGVEELFSRFSVRAVDLASGRFVADFDIDGYNQLRAARDPARSRDLSNSEDIATLGRLENVTLIYIIQTDAGIEKLVLPVRGYGLWGTLYGYLALEGDLKTISGLAFYDQKETPGLGGEVDNPKWKAQWVGVQLFDDAGEPAVRLVKTRSASGSEAAAYEVDALSGATLTTRGVENLVRFWAGELGFGPFLDNLKAEAA
ncbi:MAG: Na(+)-translocating NADH-quinone reductase subunit C [Gammaproteobacteria bacterium]|nr:MAG: Na(+)-translocating NADH-quinone reductase subunit C [Chloroflexota bacterium]TDJ23287.1 MAG: Na(+)-translocating NADH-quinone reductase subunit C [Gammaproteobacteria bacterium]TDJ39688.1 MAG: Na(+)-translocating NADH-quinone reductase subunit C [Gammaproteobacteria bacterium]